MIDLVVHVESVTGIALSTVEVNPSNKPYITIIVRPTNV